jgi:hypothetical protein
VALPVIDSEGIGVQKFANWHSYTSAVAIRAPKETLLREAKNPPTDTYDLMIADYRIF